MLLHATGKIRNTHRLRATSLVSSSSLHTKYKIIERKSQRKKKKVEWARGNPSDESEIYSSIVRVQLIIIVVSNVMCWKFNTSRCISDSRWRLTVSITPAFSLFSKKILWHQRFFDVRSPHLAWHDNLMQFIKISSTASLFCHFIEILSLKSDVYRSVEQERAWGEYSKLMQVQESWLVNISPLSRRRGGIIKANRVVMMENSTRVFTFHFPLCLSAHPLWRYLLKLFLLSDDDEMTTWNSSPVVI